MQKVDSTAEKPSRKQEMATGVQKLAQLQN